MRQLKTVSLLSQAASAFIGCKWSRTAKVCLVIAGGLSIANLQVNAETPIPIESFATLEDLKYETDKMLTRIDKALASEEAFEKDKEKGIAQAFGLLALLGQAFAEHQDSEKAPVNGPALRDAAKEYDSSGDYEAAKEAYAKTKAVTEGTVEGEHERLHDWDDLMDMYGLMEEINHRNTELLRAMRRPRGTQEELSPVVAWALMGVAMKVDNYGGGEPEDDKAWDGWTDEFNEAAMNLGLALKKKDATAAREWFDKAQETCSSCHAKFN